MRNVSCRPCTSAEVLSAVRQESRNLSVDGMRFNMTAALPQP
jgi:hypothetical protein